MNRTVLSLAFLSLVLGSLGGCNCGDDNGGDGDGADAATGNIDAAVTGPDAAVAPSITSVDYPVIAHGGQLVITGINLATASTVSIGGIDHAVAAASDTDVTVAIVLDTVSVAAASPVVVTTDLGATDPFDVTVIRLLISEIDPDTPGADNAEFIELDTGLDSSVSLAGYSVILFQGNSVAGDVLNAIDAAEGGAVTDATTGLLLIGPTAQAPDIIFDGPNAIQQGQDGVAVYQIDAASFPADYATAGNAGLIDALVYDSNATANGAVLLPMTTDDVSIDEGANSASREAVSIHRCRSTAVRREGASYVLGAPTPGAANVNCL